MADIKPCPDCGTRPITGTNQFSYRAAGTREAAEAMVEATCPNRRHDTFRQVWGLPKP